MAVSDEHIEFVRDLFCDIPAVSTRKMFGGLGIYSDGTIFAIIGPGERLMLKARGALAQDLADQGGAQFSDYEGRPANMPYWDPPESALDDPAEACDWARRALAELE